MRDDEMGRRDSASRDDRAGARRPRSLAFAPTWALVLLGAVIGVSLVVMAGALVYGLTGRDRTPAASSTQVAVPPTTPVESAAPAEVASVSAVPTEALPATEPAAPAIVTEPEPFDIARAMEHVEYLSEQIGVRRGGYEGEANGAEYIKRQLDGWGYQAEIVEFPISAGKTSRNVIAVLPGRTEDTIVLGAHMDTKKPSPGANDNGTGVAAILEMARVLKTDSVDPTVVFAFFGSEEMVDGDPNHHHFGSRYYVKTMSDSEKANLKAMVSVDMIGYGPDLVVRTMGRGPKSLKDTFLRRAKAQGLPMTYLKDPGKTGWSDHEAFELAGFPAAWIEWRDDPVYHTARDTSGHVSSAKVRTVGRFVLGWVRDF